MTQTSMRKVVLADNDIIHKLACCNLLKELLQWLGVPPVEVWVLPSMRFMLPKKLNADAPALQALQAFLTQVSDIPTADVRVLEQMSSELDPGERQMLAVLVQTPEVQHMVTGDKRALRLIGSLCAKDTELAQRLFQAQVDCLESIMLALVAEFGFEAINAKVSKGSFKDVALQGCFGAKKSEADSKEMLVSYLTELRKDAPFLPTPQPPQ